MPGGNCAIFGCSLSRRHKEIALFRVTRGKSEFDVLWRQKILQIVGKDRIVDKVLRKRFEEGDIFICEKHFTEECVNHYESGISRLKPGSVPTLCLPQKSFPSSSTIVKPRESAIRIAEKKSTHTVVEIQKNYYKDFGEFCDRARNLKLDGWQIDYTTTNFSLIFSDDIHCIPSREIFVKPSLSFVVRCFNWLLPSEHCIYKQYPSMNDITLSNLVSVVVGYQLCAGVSSNISGTGSVLHAVAIKSNPFDHQNYQQSIFHRSPECLVLINEEKCKNCLSLERKMTNYASFNVKRKSVSSTTPAKLKAPISKTNPERVKLTLQNYRLENYQLKVQIELLQKEISAKSIIVDDTLDSDISTIMESADGNNIPPFMKLFWDEQQKYRIQHRNSVRYHPMIIKFCLSLSAKSPAAYEELRYDEKTGTGILVLPSRRRLRDYKNYIRPQQGFNKEVIQELIRKVQDYSEAEKFIVLLFDEVKIQENLVWDKHTGGLIGFVDLGDPAVNYATLDKSNELATHILAFMIRSIVNPFKFSLANFATTTASSFQLFPLFWKAIGILECQCQLKVMAVTCDGASTNRKFFEMHFELNGVSSTLPTYRTLNTFADDERYIFFISDPPHLLKTARNCLYSGDGSKGGKRHMWNNGYYLSWSHIKDIFEEDHQCGLHLLPKLTTDHIYLNSYSVMNVKLAAQVLSSTVGGVLSAFGPPEAKGTSQYCHMIDKFFDIMNIRSTSEFRRDRKDFLQPFSSMDDHRLVWLEETFLQYFEDWLKSIKSRPGNFNTVAQQNMFLSAATYKGIQFLFASMIKLCIFNINGSFFSESLANFCSYFFVSLLLKAQN